MLLLNTHLVKFQRTHLPTMLLYLIKEANKFHLTAMGISQDLLNNFGTITSVRMPAINLYL